MKKLIIKLIFGTPITGESMEPKGISKTIVPFQYYKECPDNFLKDIAKNIQTISSNQ